ncbi:putative hard surface induced protein 3 [Rosellinia necatrix]|uniref:Putative hard surface induced protein 3 n=1 Tax=Rosellinia necatrix TaxID=77044 RepID=A0A1S7UJ00_ROSNE|nr:putative hard surface induced protein 3 [Rosellinia necatrix]
MPPIDEEKRHALLIDDRSPSSEGSIWGETEDHFRRIRWAAMTKAYLGLVLRRVAIFLLPSFVHHRISPARERRSAGIGNSDNTNNNNNNNNNGSGSGSGGGGGSGSNTKTLSPTSYLDGMRGLAAFFVFFCHYFYTAFFIAEGYNWLPPPPADSDEPAPTTSRYTSLWRLPFVRLLYSGPSMVCVFFVISGYALSLRPLQLARRRQGEAFARATSSLVFRRLFRLYLPPVLSTLGVALLLGAGAYEGSRAFVHDRRFVRNVAEHHPERLPTLPAQLAHWGREMWAFLHVWSWADHAGSTQYDVHLWTIPLEFRCSMVLFLVLVGTARLRENVRLAVVAALAWFVLRCDRWEMLLFLAGMAIAELDLRRHAHGSRGTAAGSPSQQHQHHQHQHQHQHQPTLLLLPLDEKADRASSAPERRSTEDSFWTAVSVFALYLLSCPDAGPSDVPGWRYLGTLIPDWFTEKYRFWQAIGACLFVFCAARSRGWQRVFELPAIQYLGHLSYAMYLMHGPVTHVLGFPVQRWAWGVTGTEGSAYKLGVALAALINIPLVIWVSDIFWRAVDMPTVRFAKWLEAKLSV